MKSLKFMAIRGSIQYALYNYYNGALGFILKSFELGNLFVLSAGKPRPPASRISELAGFFL